MEKKNTYRILAVNPGSTSTKIAVYENERELYKTTIVMDDETYKKYAADVPGQLPSRLETVRGDLESAGYDISSFDVFVGRCAGLKPLEGGTYIVDETMLADARAGTAGHHHPASLGAQICDAFAKEYGKESYMVNSPDTDEFQDISRITGLKDIYRESRGHALNSKEVAHHFCKEHGYKYEEVNLITCHLGGGITIALHDHGRMIDASEGAGTDGPLTPTRCGSLPILQVIEQTYHGSMSFKEYQTRIQRKAGLYEHLGTQDCIEIEKRIEAGDTYAKLVYDAMIYQIAKYVGSFIVAAKGDCKTVIVTGSIAHSDYVCRKLASYIEWFCPVTVMPGEFEMEALVAGVLRVKRGEERAKRYSGVARFNGFGELRKANHYQE